MKDTCNCFICNREMMFDSISNGMPDSQKVEYPSKGVSMRFFVGYGSRHDGLRGHVVICDDCFADRANRAIGLKSYF